MFEFYQVKSVKVKLIPYKYEYPSTIGAQCYASPTWSIIDPLSPPPTGSLPGSFYSYGNCKDTKPYAEHHREMRDFTSLGIQKQDKLILQTNGSALGRALYSRPTSIAMLGRVPTLGNSGVIGLLVYTITYEFSG